VPPGSERRRAEAVLVFVGLKSDPHPGSGNSPVGLKSDLQLGSDNPLVGLKFDLQPGSYNPFVGLKSDLHPGLGNSPVGLKSDLLVDCVQRLSGLTGARDPTHETCQ